MKQRINIAILGSTGSIGTQALDVVDHFKEHIHVVGLSAGSNVALLKEQIVKYNPQQVYIQNKEAAKSIDNAITSDEGNTQLATMESLDKVVIALPGLSAIKPAFAALKNKKTLLLATKEVLVSAGALITSEAKKNKTTIIPIDSEHSAILRCLQGRNLSEINKIIITCSGGPLLGMKACDLKNVRMEQVMKHPNWSMGKKITVDSATLMNKGFEVIETLWLFGVPLEKIDVVVHPQSIIHSAVEFADGSIIAQLGAHDMRIPIQYALMHQESIKSNAFKRISLTDISSLTFKKPDTVTFRCLDLAYMAIKAGRCATTMLTAANDIAVAAFLQKKLAFLQISEVIEAVLNQDCHNEGATLDDILSVDNWARDAASSRIQRVCL